MGFFSEIVDEITGNAPWQQKGYDIRQAVAEANVVLSREDVQFSPSGYVLPLEQIIGGEYNKCGDELLFNITTTHGVVVSLKTDYPKTYFYGMLDQDGYFHEMPYDFHKAIQQRVRPDSDALALLTARIQNNDIDPKEVSDEELNEIVSCAEQTFDMIEQLSLCDGVRFVDANDLIFRFLFVIAKCGTEVCSRDPDMYDRLVALHKICECHIDQMAESADKAQLLAALVLDAVCILKCKDRPRHPGIRGLQIQSAVWANLGLGAIDSAEKLSPLGDDSTAEDRRFIVCTDGLRSSECILNPAKRIFITSAEEIGNYNLGCKAESRLVFAVGHPVDGKTYIQHPIIKNQYIELGEYNARMLEYRYDDLVKLLSALGAKSIVCEVEERNNLLHAGSHNSHMQGGVHAAPGGLSGEIDEKGTFSSLIDVEKKLSTRIERQPTKRPYVPDDMVFYAFEEGWKQLAADVLSGQIKRKVMDFSFKKEYAFTSSELSSVGAKIESLVPGYQFGAEGQFADDFAKEEKLLASLVWHYEVDFGEPEIECQDAQTAEKSDEALTISASSSVIANEKAELMILGRAKRYAKTAEATKSGVLTDVQRADLEKLASKYGVDELRLEELIDEAFV